MTSTFSAPGAFSALDAFDSLDFAFIAHELVQWHEAHQRSLPWRNARPGQRDPYAVWVSEIMAQQTRLEVVTDYYLRWMDRFPTLAALAQANLQDVLKAWEGLGYYARARNLHRAARTVMNELHGVIPMERKALLALPGVGDYTAGAILSLAFGQSEPLLDGNVKRVLSRLADIDSPIEATATLKTLWALARAVVQAADAEQAGAVNEALMELGATICTPTSPTCMLCPLIASCRALARGVQELRPVKVPAKKTPHYEVAAGVIWQGAAFASPLLIAQRPHRGMLGGLWEFPGGKQEADDVDLPACLRRELAEELGISVEVGAQVTTVRHAYTHFRITLHAFHVRYVSGPPQALGCDDWRWVDLAELDQFPFPVTDLKIIKALRE